MATVTCHTPGCSNDGLPIPGIPTTWTDDDGATHPVNSITCGGCGVPITDVVP